MGLITFILGGARSGKSRFAVERAGQSPGRVLFIATAEPSDPEMRRRITDHKKNRPSHWKTVEEAKDLAGRIAGLPHSLDLVIIDCLTIFISNLLLAGKTQGSIERHIKKMLAALKKADFDALLVSNEVGLSIVPDNLLARQFRDVAGTVNQIAASAADDVYMLSAGIPVRIK